MWTLSLVDSFSKDQISSKHKGPEIMDFAIAAFESCSMINEQDNGLSTSDCVSGAMVDKRLTWIGLCLSDLVAVT